LQHHFKKILTIIVFLCSFSVLLAQQEEEIMRPVEGIFPKRSGVPKDLVNPNPIDISKPARQTQRRSPRKRELFTVKDIPQTLNFDYNIW